MHLLEIGLRLLQLFLVPSILDWVAQMLALELEGVKLLCGCVEWALLVRSFCSLHGGGRHV